jgi:DNA-binding beta-propeller fold protein YncE
MRALVITTALTMACAGCASTVSCDPGTIALTVTVSSGVPASDQLEISVAISGGAPKVTTLHHAAADGTVIVTFPHGYPAGSSVSITLVAFSGGVPVGIGVASGTLMPGCSALALTINSLSVVDLSGVVDGGADGSGLDASGLDASGDFASSDLASSDLAGGDLAGADFASVQCSSGAPCGGSCCGSGCCGSSMTCQLGNQTTACGSTGLACVDCTMTVKNVVATTCTNGCGYTSCSVGWFDCDGNTANGCESATMCSGEIAVADSASNAVTVFARTASGNLAPLRTISGALTGLSAPHGIVYDKMNAELDVTNNGSITIFTKTANGNVSPSRTITSTGLTDFYGIDVDTLNNELATVVNIGTNTLAVFSRTASGSTAPLRSISGGGTMISGPRGVAIDNVHDEIFVSNYSAGNIVVFSRTANGNVAPLRIITGVSNPAGISLDLVNNELAVANATTDSITIYARTASGAATPARIISGSSTGMNAPTGIAVDTTNNELSVSNFAGNSILVFARTANGNASALRTISGSSTLINGPYPLSISP